MASSTIRSGRSTSPKTSGTERQPSSSPERPPALRTTGLSTPRPTRPHPPTPPPPPPTPAPRRATPTWLAASPTPLAVSMVSKRSSMNRRIRASTARTSSPRCRSTGEPSRWRSRIAMLGRGRNGLTHANDAAPLHDQGGGPALDGDAVVLHVFHLPDDPAGGGDVVAPLELREDLGVLFPRLSLGPDQQEVEDQDNGPELQHQRSEA